MSTVNQMEQSPNNGEVIDLKEGITQEARSPLKDAWLRLRKNKAALLGIAIIVAYILIAIFAGFLAPKHYAVQVLDDNNAVPEWAPKVFPNIDALDADNWTFEGKKGEEVNIVMGSEQDWGVTVQVRDPDGERILIKKTGSLRYDGYEETLNLEKDGTYTINIIPKSIGTSGSYTLGIALSGSEATEIGGADGTRLEYGQSVSGEILAEGFAQVNPDYMLGADHLGRDLFSRIIYGSRVSLSVAFIGPLVSLLVGLTFGLVSGYFSGRIDNVMMRFVDIMYAFPTLLLIILMMAFFRAGFTESEEGSIAYRLNQLDARFGGMFFIFIGIGLTSWMGVSRLARGQVLSVREMEFITAARSIGTPGSSIISRHILPNILGPIVVAETLTIPAYISTEAFLSFIGLGVNRPTPSWGSMISDGARAISSFPNQAIFPALALFFIMFAFNFLGDGLRDALDPRTRRD